MVTIGVVYHSGSGHTRKMAEAVCSGLASVDAVDVKLLEIDGKDIEAGRWQNDEIMATLDRCDAIIFGSPTYMGSVSGQIKAFLDATAERYFSRAWADKIAAGFTVSGGPSGDKLNTLNTLVICALQLGMIWVGLEQIPYNDQGLNRLSFHLGAAGQAMQEPPEEAPNEQDKATGRSLGVRVATLTKKLSA